MKATSFIPNRLTSALVVCAALALVLKGVAQQRPPARPAATASISGIVVRSGSNDPLVGVRVTLAKTDLSGVSEEMSQFINGMIGRGEGGPAAEMTMPAEFFEHMKSQLGQFGIGVGKDGPVPEDFPPEMALLAKLPLESAHSIIMDPSGKMAMVPKNAPPQLTDGGGRFSFSGLEPGTYRLIFASNGFVRQDYGQRTTGSGGTPIVLEAGQSVEGLNMPLVPTGAISGRVTDSTGQAVPGAPVQLGRLAYDASAKKHTKTMAMTQTDDRGEYRFYFLTPGRYYVSAGGGVGGEFMGGIPYGEGTIGGAMAFANIGGGGFQGQSGNRVMRNYSATFYPRSADAATATPVEVAPGADVESIDIVVAAQRYYSVRGWVVESASGRAPQTSVSVMAMAADFLGAGAGDDQNYNPSDGTFELKNVAPGTYVLMADLPEWNPELFTELDERRMRSMSPAEQAKYYEAMEAAMLAAEAERPRAVATVTVGNADVDGVSLRLAKGSSISGRLRVESSGSGRALQPGRLRVQLLGSVSAAFTGEPEQGVKQDGSFKIDSVFPGDYRLSVAGLPAGYYLKAAKLGDNDALGRSIALPAEKAGALEIVVGFGVGQLDGIVSGFDGRPQPGAQAVLIPEGNRNRTELFRPVTAGANGRYSLTNITPGDYRMVAWDSLEPYGYFDPALLAQAAEKGKPVRVGESSKQTVDVQTLPVPGQ